MKNALVIALIALGLAVFDADAAKRMGGGSNLGKQRAAPTQKESAPTTPASPTQGAAPAKPGTPAATPAAPAAKPSFMQRWGGMLAGLAIGAALMSLFGGGAFGAFMTTLLIGLAIAAVVVLALRFFASRGKPAAATAQGAPMAFEGTPRDEPAAQQQPQGARPRVEIGSALTGNVSKAEVEAAPAPQASGIPGFEKEPFLRVAKTSFIRLQAANDAGDLDDIRDFTTPELYAELAMIIRERKEPQKTEVVAVNASLHDAVVEDGWEIASVRFTGLMREEAGANPVPYDELWHVRKKAGDAKASWLIMGIQQVE
jgi:predicted lipid-binding transport protein (Tim44 family)